MDADAMKKMFSDCKIEGVKMIISSNIHDVLSYVKETFHYYTLKQIIGIHKPDGLIELEYHLYEAEDDEDLIISKTIKDEVESVADLYESAAADEKEIYDMFGVKFIGNEELKRLYMPEDWDGHPLRKDYV